MSGVGSIVVTQTQTRCLCRGKKYVTNSVHQQQIGTWDGRMKQSYQRSDEAKYLQSERSEGGGGFLTKWQGLFKLTQLGHQFGSSVLPTEDFVSTTLRHMWPQTEINNEKQARHYAV